MFSQFLFGLLSVMNPCGLLIAISYLMLLLNVQTFYKSLINIVLIILLVLITYVPFGTLAGILGEFFISKVAYIVYIYPLIIIILGLSLIRGKFFRISINIGTKSLYLMIPIISLSIAFSCSLPLFLSSFIFATVQENFFKAFISIIYYALGFSITLISLTLIAKIFGQRILYKIDLRKIQKISGIFLVIIGTIIYLEYLTSSLP